MLNCYGYDFHNYKIKRYNQNLYKHVFMKKHLASFYDELRMHSPKNTVNTKKLECNMSRAKQKVFEWAMCNEWDYFVTLTLDKKKYDRYNLKKYISDLSLFIRHYRERHDVVIQYLFLPERHKDGAWHIHGFLRGDIVDLVYNGKFNKKTLKYYLTWESYSKKFGYMSIGTIDNHEAACKYMTKYITKDMSKRVTELGAHLYYVSKGLVCSELVFEEDTADNAKSIEISFENEYCMIGWRNFLTDEEKQSIADYNANNDYLAFLKAVDEPPDIVYEKQFIYEQMKINFKNPLII